MSLFPDLRLSSLVRHYRDPLFRNSLYISLSRFSEMGFGFVFWLIAAHFYTIGEVGEAAAIISSLGIVLMLSRFGFDASQIRFMKDYDREVIFNTCLWITAIGAIVIGGLYFIVIRYFTVASTFLHGNFFLFVAVAFLMSITMTTSNAFMSFQRAEFRFVQNLMLGLRIPVMIFLVSLGSLGLFLSYGAAYLITVAFGILLIVRFVPIKFEIDRDFTRETSRYTSLGYFSTLFQTIPVLIMPLLIISLSSAENAALYYIAFAFGSLVLVIPDAIGMSFFVEGSQGHPVKKGIVRAFSTSILVLIPVIVILWVFGGTVLHWLGKDYAGALELLKIFILSGFFISVYQLFLYLEGIRMEPDIACIFNIIRAVLLIVLSYAFLVMFGIIGVAWAWMFTHAILCVLILWYLRKHVLKEVKGHALFQG